MDILTSSVLGTAINLTPLQGQFGSEPAQYLDLDVSTDSAISVGVLGRRQQNGVRKSTIKLVVPCPAPTPVDGCCDVQTLKPVSILVSMVSPSCASVELTEDAIDLLIVALSNLTVREGLNKTIPLTRDHTVIPPL